MFEFATGLQRDQSLIEGLPDQMLAGEAGWQKGSAPSKNSLPFKTSLICSPINSPLMEEPNSQYRAPRIALFNLFPPPLVPAPPVLPRCSPALQSLFAPDFDLSCSTSFSQTDSSQLLVDLFQDCSLHVIQVLHSHHNLPTLFTDERRLQTT